MDAVLGKAFAQNFLCIAITLAGEDVDILVWKTLASEMIDEISVSSTGRVRPMPATWRALLIFSEIQFTIPISVPLDRGSRWERP